MTMRLPTLLLLGVTLAGCASNPPPATPTPGRPTPEAPGAPPSRVVLATDYRARVVVDRRDSVVLTLPDGGRQVQRMSRHARFSLTVERDGDLRIRLDSVAYTPAAGANLREAFGTNWTARLTPGEGVTDLRSDRRGPVALELGETLRALLPAVSREGISTGATWRDTTRSRRQVEIFEAQDERISTWTAGRNTTRDGVVLLPLVRTSSYTQLGEGSQAGRTMRMSSEGRSTITYYLTAGGLVDEITMVDDASRLITIPSTRQAIPTTQSVRVRVGFEYP